jgi:hypothetical protein
VFAGECWSTCDRVIIVRAVGARSCNGDWAARAGHGASNIRGAYIGNVMETVETGIMAKKPRWAPLEA